jgi:hypothetical protein
MNRSTFGTVLKKNERIRQHSNGSVPVQFTTINKSRNVITEYTKRPWNLRLEELHLRLFRYQAKNLPEKLLV